MLLCAFPDAGQLSEHDNGVPFYVALPRSTLDWRLRDEIAETPIEERDADEVTYIGGRDHAGAVVRVRLTPEGTPARNFGFDVTPTRYMSRR